MIIGVRRAWEFAVVALAVSLLAHLIVVQYAHANERNSAPSAQRGSPSSAREGFVYPLITPRVSSNYGPRHHPVIKVQRHHSGIDLAAPAKAPIRAIRAGTVVFADPHGAYGNLIVIKHADGYTSHYGHCDTIAVTPGTRVTAGQIIGTVGASGRVTGPHLHFELRRNGIPLNPENYFPGLATQAEG